MEMKEDILQSYNKNKVGGSVAGRRNLSVFIYDSACVALTAHLSCVLSSQLEGEGQEERVSYKNKPDRFL